MDSDVLDALSSWLANKQDAGVAKAKDFYARNIKEQAPLPAQETDARYAPISTDAMAPRGIAMERIDPLSPSLSAREAVYKDVPMEHLRKRANDLQGVPDSGAPFGRGTYMGPDAAVGMNNVARDAKWADTLGARANQMNVGQELDKNGGGTVITPGKALLPDARPADGLRGDLSTRQVNLPTSVAPAVKNHLAVKMGLVPVPDAAAYAKRFSAPSAAPLPDRPTGDAGVASNAPPTDPVAEARAQAEKNRRAAELGYFLNNAAMLMRNQQPDDAAYKNAAEGAGKDFEALLQQNKDAREKAAAGRADQELGFKAEDAQRARENAARANLMDKAAANLAIQQGLIKPEQAQGFTRDMYLDALKKQNDDTRSKHEGDQNALAKAQLAELIRWHNMENDTKNALAAERGKTPKEISNDDKKNLEGAIDAIRASGMAQQQHAATGLNPIANIAYQMDRSSYSPELAKGDFPNARGTSGATFEQSKMPGMFTPARLAKQYFAKKRADAVKNANDTLQRLRASGMYNPAELDEYEKQIREATGGAPAPKAAAETKKVGGKTYVKNADGWHEVVNGTP